MVGPLSTKIFAITGGASGIGAATCRLLAQRGAAVLCVGDANPNNFHIIREELKGINPELQVHTTQLDVRSPEAVEVWINHIVSTYGDLHGAANVAGRPQAAGVRQSPRILEEAPQSWRDTVDVNLGGVFYCTKAEVAAMVKLPPMPRSIVNVTSLVSVQHDPDIFAYRASKAAAVHFTICAANDLQGSGIRINSVAPGATNTPMLKSFIPPTSSLAPNFQSKSIKALKPSDVAHTIAWLLSEDAVKVTGASIPVGGNIP